LIKIKKRDIKKADKSNINQGKTVFSFNFLLFHFQFFFISFVFQLLSINISPTKPFLAVQVFSITVTERGSFSSQKIYLYVFYLPSSIFIISFSIKNF